MSKRWASWHDMMPGSELEEVVCAAMQGAARNLSAMIGRAINIDTQNVETVTLGQIFEYAGDPEAEMIGIYLLIDGDRKGQSVLIMPMVSALKLVDLLMGMPLGSTEDLDEMGNAALGEVGNMMVSGFLNAMAAVTGLELRPSPPAVMVDMLGAILNVVASSVAAVSDEALIIDAALRDADKAVEVRLWVLPDPAQEPVSSISSGCGQE